MGDKWEMRRNLRREMGVNGKQEETRYIIFQQKTRKTGGKTEEKNRGKNTKKQEKEQEKTENYKKYRNEILMRFREMLKTETSFQRDVGKC